MGLFDGIREKKQKKAEQQAQEALTKKTNASFGGGSGIGQQPANKKAVIGQMEDAQEKKKLVGSVIARMNKLYTEADLRNNATLRNKTQEVIDRLQRSDLVGSPALNNTIAQFLDKFINDAISALQAPNGAAAAYDYIFAIDEVISDMTSSERAKLYSNPGYVDAQVKLLEQNALINQYERSIAAINTQAKTMAADAQAVGMSQDTLNRKLKKLLEQKASLNVQIQRCQAIATAQETIIKKAVAEHNANLAGGVEQVTVDVSTAVEGLQALDEGLSGVVEINEQGRVNNLAVGNSELAMGATATGTNSEAVASENEALLSQFD